MFQRCWRLSPLLIVLTMVLVMVQTIALNHLDPITMPSFLVWIIEQSWWAVVGSSVFLMLILWLQAQEVLLPKGDPDPALSTHRRQQLLDHLKTRYERRRDDNLDRQVRIALNLHTHPTALTPQSRLHWHGASPSRPIAPDCSITEVFSQANQALLILGEPGAGKTTLLLKLACELLDVAQADAQQKVPVLLNLAAWAQRQKPLEEWLPEALHTEAGIRKKWARRLLDEQQLLLLLDGLDEVAPNQRAACIAAINAYLDARRPMPIAIASRSAEYAQAGLRLNLDMAVEVAPLTLPQIEAALMDIPQADGVLLALRTDPLLPELLTTPLMLQITLLAYAGATVPHLQAQTVDERREALFAAYVRRMLQQRRTVRYTPQQIVAGLHWLAARMRQDGMSNFRLDRMQPDWLPTLTLRTYRWLTGLIVALVVGLSSALAFGWVVGLIFGLLFGLAGVLNYYIEPYEQVGWSWRAAGAGMRVGLRVGLGVGLGVGLVFWLVLRVIGGLGGWLGGGLVVGLLSGLVNGLVRGQVSKELETTNIPTQGIWAALGNGGLAMMVIGLVVELISALVGVMVGGLVGMLVVGLGVGLIGGLIVGLNSGLGAFLKHYLLRWLLARQGVLPWDAVRFLDTASELLLLQRDWAIYRFRHLLLRDYFATLTPEAIAALVRPSDASA